MDSVPVILLAFANDRTGQFASLREELARERREIGSVLAEAEQARWCKVEVLPEATPGDVVKAFQYPPWRGRIVIFHFSGHADSEHLLFESENGGVQAAAGMDLAEFLGRQKSLRLVFLNGCATEGQVSDLLSAGMPAVIATRSKVDSLAACDFAVLFYRALAQGRLSLQNAFQEARSGARLLRGSADNRPFGAERGLIFSESTEQALTNQRHAWRLHIRPGGEAVNDWCLDPDPLAGLRLPSDIGLPAAPFLNLQSFSREQAGIFFGRAKAIKAMHDQLTEPDAAAIALLCGQSGVGKSSFLFAGLLPRLESVFEIVAFERPPLTQADNLKNTQTINFQALNSQTGLAANFADACRLRASEPGKSLLIVVDHAEKLLPENGADVKDWEALRRQWVELFKIGSEAGRCKWLLSFRKEWLADMTAALDAHALPHSLTVLERLDRQGLLEAIEGVFQNPRCRDKYRLTLGAGRDGLPLAVNIADDLLADRLAPLAPTLQILMSRLWARAKALNDAEPEISLELYEQEKRRGLLLQDFLQERMAELEHISPELAQSGLALDILHRHTNELGAAVQCSMTVLEAEYAHCVSGLHAVVDFFESCFVLTDATGAGRGAPKFTRLSHDTLAPLVRREFQDSIRPGQQARRLLEERIKRALTALPVEDLPVVESGRGGMRQWTSAECKLVQSARLARGLGLRRRLKRRCIWFALCLALLASAVEIAWQWWDGLMYQSKVLAENARREAGLGHAELGRLLALEALPGPRRIRPWSANAETALAYALGAPADFPAPPHPGVISDAQFSPDGRVLAVASEQGVYLWGMHAGQWNGMPPAARLGFEGNVRRLSFSADARYLLTLSEEHAARIWDVSTGLERLRLEHEGEVSLAEIPPGGEEVVTLGKDGKVRVWRGLNISNATRASGAPVTLSEKNNPPRILAQAARDSRMAFSHAAKRFALSMGDSVSLIDWESGKERQRFTLSQPVSQLAFGASGRFLAAATQGEIRVWDIFSGGEYLRFAQNEGTESLVFSPDERWLAAVSPDNTVSLWSMASGMTLLQWRLEAPAVRVSFSPDGNALALAFNQAAPRIINLEHSRETLRVEHTGSVESAEFSPDGLMIATASVDGEARVTDAQSGALLFRMRHGSEVNHARFSADGKLLATAAADGSVRIWDLRLGRERLRMQHTNQVLRVTFDAAGENLLSVSRDGTARVWDVADGREKLCLQHDGEVRDAVFSPDGQWILTASADGFARLWQAADGREKFRWRHDAGLKQAAFSPDGQWIVTAAADGGARVFSAADGGEKWRLRHADSVESAAFSPDGQFIVTASADRAARIWRAADGKELWHLPHRQALAFAAFSPDGRHVVTAARESLGEPMSMAAVRVFDLASGQERFFIPHDATVTGAVFSPDGLSLLTHSPDRTARLWREPDLLLDGQALIDHVRAHGLTRHGLSAEERRRFFLDEKS